MFSFSYINYTMLHDRNCMLSVSLRTVQSLPLGGTSVMKPCSCFGLNRLAMNSCQAARHHSRSLLMFVAIRASAFVFSVVDVSGFYWVPFWTEMDYQIEEW